MRRSLCTDFRFGIVLIHFYAEMMLGIFRSAATVQPARKPGDLLALATFDGAGYPQTLCADFQHTKINLSTYGKKQLQPLGKHK